MLKPVPHPPETRAAAEAMIRAGDLSTVEIAARTGVPPSTVHRWKCRIGPSAKKSKRVDPLRPEAWTARRRAAVVRLLTEPEVDPGDVAVALGGPRLGASSLRSALGLARRKRTAGVPGVGDLDAALRTHIGRQIAALDARLKADDPGLDPGKALRDLGGLKRLLDELIETTPNRNRDGEVDGEPEEDLAVLRERIARRYAAFAPDWAESCLGTEPDADTADGARS